MPRESLQQATDRLRKAHERDVVRALEHVRDLMQGAGGACSTVSCVPDHGWCWHFTAEVPHASAPLSIRFRIEESPESAASPGLSFAFEIQGPSSRLLIRVRPRTAAEHLWIPPHEAEVLSRALLSTLQDGARSAQLVLDEIRGGAA